MNQHLMMFIRVINLNEYTDIVTHCIVLYSNDNTKTDFDSFGFENILNQIIMFLDNKNKKVSIITTNIYIILVYHLVMCGYFCIAFIDFML